jgi:hypothetical protein
VRVRNVLDFHPHSQTRNPKGSSCSWEGSPSKIVRRRHNESSAEVDSMEEGVKKAIK